MKAMDHLLNNGYKSFTQASSLLSYPTVFKGIARIVDLWGTLDEYNYSKTEEDADRKSLMRDYRIIMGDLAEAEKQHGQKRVGR